MKLYFLGKVRGKNFLTQILVFGSFYAPPAFHPTPGVGVRGSHKFSTAPELSEYVHVLIRNTNGTCLKSVSKTPTFRFFRDFQPLKRHIQTSSQMAHFDQFLAKMAKTVKIIKKRLENFSRAYKP